MKRWTAKLLTLFALMVTSTSLSAQTAPHGTCGSLPPNSFGGSGISTSEVMLGGSFGALLGLSASPRYTSPAFTSDGNCTFFSETGNSTGGPVNLGFAKWNFNYFTGGTMAGNLFLLVDLDPGLNNSFASMTTFALPWGAFDSSNLGYFGSSLFDPNVAGQYTFAIEQRGAFGQVLDYVAINVNVEAEPPVTTTPEPASTTLLATGLLGLAGLARRRKKN